MEIKVIIDDFTKFAFDIVDKNISKRTNEEKLWLKLHGGEYEFLKFQFEIEKDVKSLRYKQGSKKKLYQYHKPLKATDERLKELYEYLQGKNLYDFPKIIKLIKEVDLYYERKPDDLKYAENRKEILKIKKF